MQTPPKFFIVFFLICFLGSLIPVAFAQVKYSNEFLSIGVGARALGMQNAISGISDDVTSSYWNPAGMINSKNKSEVGLMHSEYFAGIAKYDYAGWIYRVDPKSNLGLSVIRFGVDDIPNTLDLVDNNGQINYDNISSFSVSDNALIISYAKKNNYIKELNMGMNAKIIYRKAGKFATAWGFGLDAGIQYVYKNFMLGAMCRDITSTFNAWSFNTKELAKWSDLNNDLPESSLEITMPKLLVGTGYNFIFFKSFNFLLSTDLDFSFDGKRNVLVKSSFASIDPHAGVEFGFKKIVFLRGGIGNIQSAKNFDGSKYRSVEYNAGVGLKINLLTIDYALTDIGDFSETLYSHVFSVKIDIK